MTKKKDTQTTDNTENVGLIRGEDSVIEKENTPKSIKKKEKIYNNLPRILSWVFSKSGIVPLALEHFLAMLPATILVPILVNNACGSIIDVSLVLFTSGLGTVVFCFFSSIRIDKENKKLHFGPPIPAYLGSSFAYIAITIFLLESQKSQGMDPSLAFSYVGWAYFFSSLLLIILSTLFYFVKGIDRFFTKYFPAAVIGPAISLIGLELSDTAIADAGFRTEHGGVDIEAVTVSMITLAVIIVFSLVRRKFWKNAAIIVGMISGYVAYVIINGLPAIDLTVFSNVSLPDFNLPLLTPPPNLPALFIAIIPATLVVFTENIGRVTVINRMQEEDGDAKLFDEKSVKKIGSAVLSHGVASLASSFVGSVPNTIYAENIAVMGIHRNKKERLDPCPLINKMTDPYSCVPYLIAAALAMIVSFFGAMQNVILGIPKAVIGGMELFLFGVISAPGIQLLVEQRVNYKKISNQVVTAAVLLTGISEMSISISWFELKGMSLGLVVGFVLNFIVLALKWVGVLCDPVTMEEVVVGCLSSLPKEDGLVVVDIPAIGRQTKRSGIKKIVSCIEGYGDDLESEHWRDIISHATEASLYDAHGTLIVSVNKRENSLCVDIRKDALDDDVVTAYLNDYKDATDIDLIRQDVDGTDAEFLVVDLSRSIPLRKIETLIRQIDWKRIG